MYVHDLDLFVLGKLCEEHGNSYEWKKPDWLHPFTENLEDLETHVLAHFSEREISDSEGDASKVGTQKTEAQC